MCTFAPCGGLFWYGYYIHFGFISWSGRLGCVPCCTEGVGAIFVNRLCCGKGWMAILLYERSHLFGYMFLRWGNLSRCTRCCCTCVACMRTFFYWLLFLLPRATRYMRIMTKWMGHCTYHLIFRVTCVVF